MCSFEMMQSAGFLMLLRLRQVFFVIPACVVASYLVLSPSAMGENLAYGEYLASECVTCHQLSGASRDIPSIIGWPENQFLAVLFAYKNKDRESEVMQTIAGRLSNNEMKALAAYFASLTPQDNAPPECTQKSSDQSSAAC